jgi:N-acyl-D-amino-acid deacylase
MPDTTHDIVLRGGRVVDGCGNPWFTAHGPLHGRRVIDVDGRYVAPGFVDPHTHSDVAILQYPRADSAVRQGVTTHVTGNCGVSAAPIVDDHLDELVRDFEHYWDVAGVTWHWRSFADYLATVEASGTALNIAALVGHGTLRIAAMGFAERAPGDAELDTMRQLLAAGMEAGAFGLSTGLVYPPGCYAATAEIVELAKVVSRHGGIYASHVRGERETILEAVAEAIDVGRVAGVAVELSHNAPKYGFAEGASANLALVEAARARGQDVTVDNDTHTDLAPRFSRALPQPVLELDHEALMSLLRDPEGRAKLRADVEQDRLPGAGYTGLLKHGRFDRIVVLHAGRHPALRGRSVAAIAADRDADAFETYLDLIVDEDDDIVGIFDYIEEEDIRALLTHPAVMVSSDGLVMPPADAPQDPATYWPCSYGEYPGVLERYVRQEPVLRLEEAIRKMTSFPAQRFGLLDRGVLRPGMRADLVVFDLDRIRDRATNLFPHSYPFANVPHDYPEGIDYVVVNGTLVVDGGDHTGAMPGRVLRHA